MTNSQVSVRLEGLDLARFVAFAGMVVVNFKMVMGAENGGGTLGLMTGALEGRAAATFVVLAGIGLGLSAIRGNHEQVIAVTIKRAVFLLVLGLLNSLVFDADILHYYAFYFLLGVSLLKFQSRWLIASIVLLNVMFVLMVSILDYDAEWNWENYSYAGFWTATGFVRNLFFNGWHPVIPWLGFLLFGLLLSRTSLSCVSTQNRLIVFGTVAVVVAEIASKLLAGPLNSLDPELVVFATTELIPPMPLYVIAGSGVAAAFIGLCLRYSDVLARSGILSVVTPAGRQTLTLYIAHILVGMGTLEALGMLGNQSVSRAVVAALAFCLFSVIYALIWSKFFKRGPIEAAMRKIAG